MLVNKERIKMKTRLLLIFLLLSIIVVSNAFCFDNDNLINSLNGDLIRLQDTKRFDNLDDLIISGYYFYTSQLNAEIINVDQYNQWDLFFHEWCVKATRNHIINAKMYISNEKRNDAINELLHAQYLWNCINKMQDNEEIVYLLNTLLPNRID